MLKRLLATSAGLLLVAACGDTPSQPSLDAERPTTAFAKADRISICHLDADLGRYFPIEINGNAETAHRRHGDGQVGDAVPGTEGAVFDDDCQAVFLPSGCFSAAIQEYESVIGPWSWSDNGPWSVSADTPGSFIAIQGAGDAQAFFSTFLGYCLIAGRDGPGVSKDGYTDEDFAAVRAFLLSQTQGS